MTKENDMKDFGYLLMILVLLPVLALAYCFTSGKDQSEINAKWDNGAE